MCKLSVMSQEWLKIEVKLLLSANRKSYMPRRLAQQRMTLSDLERPSHASRAISAVAECLVSCVVVHDDFAAAAAGDLMLMLVVVVQYT